VNGTNGREEQALAVVQGPVVPMLPSTGEMNNMLEMAKVLYKGGLLPGTVRSPEAAFTIMLKGRELGISAMNAFANINIISGKPTLSADLMIALVRRAGHKVWVVRSSADECVMKGHRRGESEHQLEIAFTIEDARRANLAGKDTWKLYPSQMLYARCASRIARMIASEELAGIYAPEELGADVRYTEDGQEIITVPAEPLSFTPAKPTALVPDLDPLDEAPTIVHYWPEITEDEYNKLVKAVTNGQTPDEVRKQMGFASKRDMAAAIKAKYSDRPVQTPGEMLSAALELITDYYTENAEDKNF
jgi:hypothetical protein